MAEVKTVDVTSFIDTDQFPVNTNEVYDLVEKLAVQNIENAKSANVLEDAFKFYDVTNGTVIEESVIEMAESQAFNATGIPTFAPNDPQLYVKYFNNWDPKTYPTTIRRNDIRKIIANKGVGVEDVVSKILDTITQAYGAESYENGRNLLLNAPSKDFSTILGGVPKNMKGVIFAAREMYNHLKSNNDDLTAKTYVSSVPDADIRIAITDSLMNLIDVVELADTFNLSKEELFGKLVVIPASDLPLDKRYKLVVYDVKAMGHGRRLYEYAQDAFGETLTSNHFLHADDCWFFNGLFKSAQLDCLEAAETERATIVDTPTAYTITATITHAESDNDATSIYKYQSYNAVLTADEGYTLEGATVTALTMGGTDISDTAWDEDTGIINIPQVIGDLVITISAKAE